MAKPFRIRTGALASALLLLGAPALSLAVGGGDLDGDGIPDEVDNCLARANPDQVDTNADGFGNLCDPDLDNDGSVSFSDLSILKAAFFSSPQTPNWDPDADLSGDEQVNFTDLAVMRSFFFLPPGPAGVVRWANPAGGDWDTPENWLPVGPPRPENLVILDLPDADPVITLTGGSADIYALVSTERLEIIDDDVALSVRGPSSIDGELILTAGGTLIADGEDAVVSVGDSSDLDDGSLIARGGAELTLEQSDIAMALDQATWLAEGAGSRIAFPNLTLAAAGVVGSSSAVRWTVEARDGGVIEMPGLSTMEIVGQSVASRIEIVADGTGSAVSAPMLTAIDHQNPTGLSTNGSRLSVIDGGVIEVPLLATLARTDLSIENTVTGDFAQITAMTDAELSVTGGSIDFPALTTFTNSEVVARDGAVVVLPFSGYALEEKTRTWQADGAGSAIVLPSFFTGTVGMIGSGVEADLDIQALNGGVVDMPVLAGLVVLGDNTSSTIDLLADGNGSLVRAPGLSGLFHLNANNTSLTGNSQISLVDDGVVETPLLTTLDRVNLSVRNSATALIEQLTAMTDARLTLEGASVTSSSLMNFANSSAVARDGAVLSLPVANYTLDSGDVSARGWGAFGAGSAVVLPNLTQATAGVGGSDLIAKLNIEARDGAAVQLSMLNTLEVLGDNTASGIGIVADGANSLVNMPVLSTFDQQAGNPPGSAGNSSLVFFDGGEIAAPMLTELNRVHIFVRNTNDVALAQQLTHIADADIGAEAAAVAFPSLLSLTNTDVTAMSGAVVELPITTTNFPGQSREWEARGAGSAIMLPNLEQATVGEAGSSVSVNWAVDALSGGLIDMPVLTTLEVIGNGTVSQIDILASGANSLVSMVSLALFSDNGGTASTITEASSGVVDYPQSAVLINVTTSP